MPDHILLKPEKLTEEEWSEMRQHPAAGFRIVKRIGFLKEAAEIVYSHQEHFDGSGYPRGLKGEEIPLGARIFMVADAYDALTSERPYHSPVTDNEARMIIKGDSGKQFDPQVVEFFLAVDQKALQAVKDKYTDKNEDIDEEIKIS